MIRGGAFGPKPPHLKTGLEVFAWLSQAGDKGNGRAALIRQATLPTYVAD
jgi:hypothetical protein